MEDLKNQAERFGTDVRFGVVTKVNFSDKVGGIHKVTVDESNEIEAETVIISTGATAKYLGLESEQRLIGGGVSACATCDGFFYKGQDVIVVGAGVMPADAEKQALIVLTSTGYGKKTKMREYKVQKRAGSGIKTVTINDKTKELIGAAVVDREGGELIAISKNGQVIRTALDEVPVLGRATVGVRIMKLRAGDAVASMITLHDSEEAK